jgi:hypothetical protein
MGSAPFKSWQDVQLLPGDEVAQIDSDGESSYVTWTVIEDVITKNGVPRIVVRNVLNKGASGGGVFWNGYHIANNWGIIELVNGSGRVDVETSIAALNQTLIR